MLICAHCVIPAPTPTNLCVAILFIVVSSPASPAQSTKAATQFPVYAHSSAVHMKRQITCRLRVSLNIHGLHPSPLNVLLCGACPLWRPRTPPTQGPTHIPLVKVKYPSNRFLGTIPIAGRISAKVTITFMEFPSDLICSTSSSLPLSSLVRAYDKHPVSLVCCVVVWTLAVADTKDTHSCTVHHLSNFCLFACKPFPH